MDVDIRGMSIPYSVEATLDRFEGDSAVLRLTDGQELEWPSENIPDELEEGSIVRLALVMEDAAPGDRRALAQDILNEIFSGEEEV